MSIGFMQVTNYNSPSEVIACTPTKPSTMQMSTLDTKSTSMEELLEQGLIDKTINGTVSGDLGFF